MGVNERGGRLIGYARVSTLEQNLDMQIDALLKYGVHKNHMLVEKMSASATRRPILDLTIKSLRKDDTMVVWKWDRLARSVIDMLKRSEDIKAKGAELVSITEKFDTSTPMGAAFFHLAALFAQLERDMIRQRTLHGVAAAKARGVAFGQPKKIQSKKTVSKIKGWRKERIPYREIRKRLISEDKLKLSITTIEKYATGKVKI